MWITLLSRFWYVLVIVALLASTAWYRNSAEKTQLKFDAFVSETKALGEQAKAHKIEKEYQDAKQITDAVTSRNAALASLRTAQANASRSRVPLAPQATAGSSQICFDPPALSAAVERYRGRVRGLVETGDEANIDAKALIQAWPK